MAKANSKKGAVSCHTKGASTTNCLRHNRRAKMASNVNPALSHLNQSWESGRIRSVKDMRSMKRRAEKLYTDKVGQKCQASFTPFRESVLRVKDGSTIEEARQFAATIEAKHGVECLGIWLHLDEGSARSKYDPSKPFVCNYHVHILWDCQNHNTGKAIPFKKADLREMQDLAAAAFGMERGTPAELTGKRHVESMEFKMKQMAAELEELRIEVQELRAAKTAAAETVATIKEVGKAARDLVTGKTKREKKDLENKISRLSEENKKLEITIVQVKKASEIALNEARGVFLQERQKAEFLQKNLDAKRTQSEAQADKWKQRFAAMWPAAPAAIAAIVERCTTTIKQFSQQHIVSIEAALHNATSKTERKQYAADLWQWAAEDMPNSTYKKWIADGKEELNKLVNDGPEYQRERSKGLHY